jgi:catechol 2,3-dioxygenase-like lactoylglutathione lyase family enzyme
MIQHVTRQIPPTELDECLRFYGILGFEPVPAPPSIRGRAVWLGARGACGPGGSEFQIHLMPAEDARPEQGHVALVVDDYEATLERLRAAGFEVEPRRPHWGAARAFARDPASNVVELMAAPPPPSPPGYSQPPPPSPPGCSQPPPASPPGSQPQYGP